MTTKRKVKKAAARRERIRLEKAARKAMCSAERSAERERQRVFKDIKTFFNEIADESADLIYRKEQIKAGLIGEIRRIRILKDKDPDKYAKLSTKIYEDCVAKIDNKIQPDLVKLAGLIDKFKDHPNAGDSSLTSSFEASELLGDIASGLNEIVDTAEGLYHQVDDTVAGIENPETNPIAEEAKQQTDSGTEGAADNSSAETPAAETSEVKVEDAANDDSDQIEAMEADFTPETDLVQVADRTPESLPLADVTEVIPDEIEADPDALNKIIDAQADSKSDVVVNPLDVIKKTQLIPLTANDNDGVLLRHGNIRTNASANLFTLSSFDVSDSSHKVDVSVKLHSVVVELSLDNDKELFELQIDQLKDAALISKPKNDTANVRGTFVEYEFDLTKNVKKLDGSDSVILGKLADDESIHSKLAFTAQINLDDSNIQGYGVVSFASHTDFQANVVGYTVDAYCAPALALNKPAESLPEPPKEVIVDVNSIPEINMTDTNQNTAASGNTFDDQEVDIVATPAAAKGNTNVDQETSVDADTVNKILNEQNNTSQA